MAMKKNVLCIALMLTAGAVACHDALASGGGDTRRGGGTIYTTPGQCNSTQVTSSSYLSKVSNAWQFGITVVGPGAGDTWVVQWFKNGTFVSATQDVFPSGFTTIGLASSPADKGTVVSFMAVATSASGAVCNAAVSVKV